MKLRSGGVGAGVAAAAVVWTLVFVAGPALAADAGCTATDGEPVCLDGVSVSDERLAKGESATLEATVRNAGETPANATVVLNTAGPDNVTRSFTLGRVRLAPGETRTVTQPIDASTPGSHGLQLLVFDGSGARTYDSSAVLTVAVTERGLGGALDRSEYALGALVGAVAVVGGLGYRRR
ncbi:hypothetical protein [Candidatus Halobonum tyrrellensis]|uniref:CARDB domain-containing protein n=1 Tax=Candidatus Halobonum tyrrellensis G22 TaxID=1324957 RepID=V4HE77_9EURY|nr:hypothetical protein [Candidatus Halobonum tyrrellensis]ESP88353.1 hypothetical protein K933_09527 [Candidatus Halobonum tyrrellensis G22]